MQQESIITDEELTIRQLHKEADRWYRQLNAMYDQIGYMKTRLSDIIGSRFDQGQRKAEAFQDHVINKATIVVLLKENIDDHENDMGSVNSEAIVTDWILHQHKAIKRCIERFKREFNNLKNELDNYIVEFETHVSGGTGLR